jgi:hypothetical protein
MSVFDLPHAHMPPSYESAPGGSMWDYLATMWNADHTLPAADPSYKVTVIGQSCVVVTEDGKERFLF